MNEKILTKELTKARISETDFLIKRKKQKQSYIDSKIEKYVPEGLAGTLTAAFTKAFEIIFRDGTGVIKRHMADTAVTIVIYQGFTAEPERYLQRIQL